MAGAELAGWLAQVRPPVLPTSNRNSACAIGYALFRLPVGNPRGPPPAARGPPQSTALAGRPGRGHVADLTFACPGAPWVQRLD